MLRCKRCSPEVSPANGPPLLSNLPARSSRVPEIRFTTAADGRRLAVRVWAAEKARMQVVLLHGIVSHSGWYGGSCRSLSDAGFEVHFIDRRGSGLNADDRGHVDRWETWCDDVVRYLERIRDRRPVVLCGISWGGKLAAAVARRKPHLIDGLGLLCPGLFAQQQPGPFRRLALKVARCKRLQDWRVRVPLHEPELFTNSPCWQEYLRNDPLILREVTLQFARADLQLTRYARQSATFIHTPILLMLAGQDRITSNDSTRRYLGHVAAHHKMLIEYQNAAHTLEFELDPSPYFNDLAAWVQKIGEQTYRPL